MEDTELIAKQARQIAELEESIAYYKAANKAIHMIIFGVGGPLNDNKLGYSKAQMWPFSDIAAQIR